MNIKRCWLVLIGVAMWPMCGQAQAVWLSASATQVDKSDSGTYVTVDVSASPEAFVSRNPVTLDGLTITDPDGKAMPLEDKWLGKTRSSADFKLTRQGTYKASLEMRNVMVSYRQAAAANATPAAGSSAVPASRAGLVRRVFTPEEFNSFKLPDDATQVRITRNLRRAETFVTYDRSSALAGKLAGTGLEMQPLTNPNDMLPGDKFAFRLLFNGKPLANHAVSLVPEGQRYRGVMNEVRLTTDDKGEASAMLAHGGKYWLSATYPVRTAPAQPQTGQPPAENPPANAAPIETNAYAYGAALEVLY